VKGNGGGTFGVTEHSQLSCRCD